MSCSRIKVLFWLLLIAIAANVPAGCHRNSVSIDTPNKNNLHKTAIDQEVDKACVPIMDKYALKVHELENRRKKGYIQGSAYVDAVKKIASDEHQEVNEVIDEIYQRHRGQ